MPALKKIDGGEKKHRPRKRFGQHFLRAPEIAQRIADAVSPQENELIVEIGPGDGALTAPLLAAGARIFAVEIDRDLAAALRNRFADSPIQIIESDAAKMDFNAAVAGEFRAVGNLPYNISADLNFIAGGGFGEFGAAQRRACDGAVGSGQASRRHSGRTRIRTAFGRRPANF